MTTMRAPSDLKVDRVLRRNGDVVYKGQVLFYAALTDAADDETPVKSPGSGTLKYNQSMRPGLELKAGEEILTIATADEEQDLADDQEKPAPSRDKSKVVWAGPVKTAGQDRRSGKKGKKKSRRRAPPQKQQQQAPRGNPLLRAMGCCVMLGGSALFFVLAKYHYDYLGELIDLSRTTPPGPDLAHVSAVHGFYTKTFITNISLGVVAVVAGLAIITDRMRLATFIVGLWAMALAVSQGLTLYVMYADNILLGTYLKGGLLAGVVITLYWQRRTPGPAR